MRYLILGRNSFIAAYLERALRLDDDARGLRTAGAQIEMWGSRNRGEDLCSPLALRDYLRTAGAFDAVINCAGDARMWFCDSYPVASLHSNVLTAINVEEALSALAYQPRLIHLSSCTAAQPATVYGHHKRLAEFHINRYPGDKRLLRPGSVFGSGMKKGPVLDAMEVVLAGYGMIRVTAATLVPLTSLEDIELRTRKFAAGIQYVSAEHFTGCLPAVELVEAVAAVAGRPMPKLEWGREPSRYTYEPVPLHKEALRATWDWYQAAIATGQRKLTCKASCAGTLKIEL